MILQPEKLFTMASLKQLLIVHVLTAAVRQMVSQQAEPVLHREEQLLQIQAYFLSEPDFL